MSGLSILEVRTSRTPGGTRSLFCSPKKRAVVLDLIQVMAITSLFRATLFPVTRLLLAAFAILLGQGLLGQGAAQAGIFTISGGVAEAVGDNGGTSYANSQNDKPGQGLPTVAGFWPNTPTTPLGFSPDPLFGDARGISGYSNYGAELTVTLNADRLVHFTWMGMGDATYENKFLVDSGDGNGFQVLWQGPYGGHISPASYDIALSAGVIKFKWITGSFTPETVANGDMTTNGASFFAGVDPYAASAAYQRSGDSIYLGLSDRARQVGDHDYQDLGVRLDADPLDQIIIPVPEPGTFTSMLIGLLAGGGLIRSRLADFRKKP